MENSRKHQWYYYSEKLFHAESKIGPIDETAFVLALDNGVIAGRTKVLSHTRTNGKWKFAKDVPFINDYMNPKPKEEFIQIECSVCNEQFKASPGKPFVFCPACHTTLQVKPASAIELESEAPLDAMPTLKQESELRSSSKRLCRACKEPIHATATRCPHCTEFQSVKLARDARKDPTLQAIVSVCILIAFGALLWGGLSYANYLDKQATKRRLQDFSAPLEQLKQSHPGIDL